MKKILLVSLFSIFQVSCSKDNPKITEMDIHALTKEKKLTYISKTGVISCFPEGTKNKIIKKNKIEEVDATCELSAVVFNNNQLIFGNDKSTDNALLSSIFSIPFHSSSLNSPIDNNYYTNNNFLFPKKYEDFAISLDHKYIFATTSFDRQSNNSEYNSIIYWQTNNKDSVEFINIKAGDTYSKDLYKYISKSLNNPKYFKIEGLAVIPKNKILFGIREIGESYKNFNYSFKIVSVSFEEVNSKIYFKDDFKVVYNFQNTKKYVKEDVGISSLAWDEYNKRLLILTSFEHQPKDKNELNIGAYLWTLKLNQLSINKDPELIYTKDGPLKFNNKAEGIAILNKNEIFVINDDDRELKPTSIDSNIYTRKPNEAIYNIIRIN